jgi:mannose-6-phosphate isomerase-like protein (cupin superfamily)
MHAFELSKLVEDLRKSGDRYMEFLRVPSLSAGIYALPAGGVDLQQPHTEDEVYTVVGGRGMIRVGEEDRAVTPGSVIFVKANVEHRFHSIEEDLTLLVFFAPAEGMSKT